jgi:hypothetical protein
MDFTRHIDDLTGNLPDHVLRACSQPPQEMMHVDLLVDCSTQLAFNVPAGHPQPSITSIPNVGDVSTLSTVEGWGIKELPMMQWHGSGTAAAWQPAARSPYPVDLLQFAVDGVCWPRTEYGLKVLRTCETRPRTRRAEMMLQFGRVGVQYVDI